MKNLFFVLVLFTISFSSVAYEKQALNEEIIIEINSQNDLIQVINPIGDNYDLENCEITIIKKNPDGEDTEVTIIIKDKSCGEVIKDIMDNL